MPKGRTEESKRDRTGPVMAWPITLACLAFLSFGCDAGPEVSDEGSFLVYDSAGTEIVESRRPIWTEATRWRVEASPALVIKSPEAEREPPFILFGVGDIVPLSDGRMVIENRGTDELLIMDSLGSYLESWGGTGDGPGEFRQMARLFRCPGDTLVVQENRRATVFDAQGNVIRTRQLRMDLDTRGLPSVDGVSRDCSRTLWSWWPRNRVNRVSGRGTVWQMNHLGWVPPGSGMVDSLGMVLWGELREDGWGYPFPLTPSWATDGEFVFYGPGDRAEIQVLGRDGRVVRLIRWATSPAPITEEVFQEYEEQWAQAEEYDPSIAAGRATRGMVPYDSMPVFAESRFLGNRTAPVLRLDGEGNLWVRRYAPVPYTELVPHLRRPLPAQRWWIFDPTGRWLGELETPENLLVRSIEKGLILGVSRDTLDVEEVRGYRIRMGTPPG